MLANAAFVQARFLGLSHGGEEQDDHDHRRQKAFQRVLAALATARSGSDGDGVHTSDIIQFLHKQKEEESLQAKKRSEEEREKQTILFLKEQRKNTCLFAMLFCLHRSVLETT